MLQAVLERVDDPTTVAGRLDLAYQSAPAGRDSEALIDPGAVSEPLGDPPLGEVPVPRAATATAIEAGLAPGESDLWQQAMEQLLETLAAGASAAGGATPAAYVAPAPGGPTLPEAGKESLPLYVIEPLSGEHPEVLSLDESDLFGSPGEREIDLLGVRGAEGAAAGSFQGMDSDLFGNVGNDVTPIVISKHQEPPAPSIAGSSPPLIEPPDGYISLLGDPLEIELSVDEARQLANEQGELFIDGDGDDRVLLSGAWIFTGARPDKGAEYYTDASGQLDLTVHNSETVLV